MKKYDISVKNYKCIILGTAIGLITSFVFILLMAILFTSLDLAIELAHPMSSIACGMGAFIGGFTTSKLCKSKGLINGSLTGAFIFLFLMLLSLIISDGSVTIMTLIRFIIIICASSIGGILGLNALVKKRLI